MQRAFLYNEVVTQQGITESTKESNLHNARFIKHGQAACKQT